MTRTRVLVITAAVLCLLATVSAVFTPAITSVAGAPLTSAQQRQVLAAQPVAQAAPAGNPVPMTTGFINALHSWSAPNAGNVGNSHSGKRDSWFQDCTSGKVDTTLTQGWCWVPKLHMFFNYQTLRLLDPMSGRVFAVTLGPPGPPSLTEVVSEETDEGVRPPFFSLRGAAPEPLSLQCTPAQQALVQQHVAGLQANAQKTDSPAMAAMFNSQATFWGNYCA
jgi:hypothetical protein